MEQGADPNREGLDLTPEQMQELSTYATELTSRWLEHPILKDMHPSDKKEVQTFIDTSFDALARNNLVVNDKSVSEIAIATAPGLERRRLKEKFTDGVTGLSNGEAFMAARQRIDDDPNSELLFLDLISLGEINNKVSYDTGTQTLIRAAACIKAESEKLDIDERDIFRVGGDEFGVRVPKGHARYLLLNILGEFGEHRFDKNVVTGLRGAYGDSFEDVDRKMQELKLAGKKNRLARKFGYLVGKSPALVTHLDAQ